MPLTCKKQSPQLNLEVSFRLNDNRPTPVENFIKNFPFPTMRERQSYVLNEIANALASNYKYILLEDPTGFGKSPVAIAVGRTLGTSYMCTSTGKGEEQFLL